MVNVPNAVDAFANNIAGLNPPMYYDYISAQDSSKVQKSGGAVTRTTTPASTSCTLHIAFTDPDVDEQFQIFYVALTNDALESEIEVGVEEYFISEGDQLTVVYNVQVG